MGAAHSRDDRPWIPTLTSVTYGPRGGHLGRRVKGRHILNDDKPNEEESRAAMTSGLNLYIHLYFLDFPDKN